MTDFDHVGILLVEEKPNDAEMTRLALQDSDLLNKLFWVRDGGEALDFIACRGADVEPNSGELPKLILLDLKLPKVDGLEVLQTLKADDRTCGIPIVWKSIKWVEAPPAQEGAALAGSRVDAATITETFLSAAIATGGRREVTRHDGRRDFTARC